MTKEEIHQLPWEAQLYINELQRQLNNKVEQDETIENLNH